jgi:hypothetical protein
MKLLLHAEARLVVATALAICTMASCGYGNQNPPRSVTGIQVLPGNPTAYSSQASPKNQAIFTADVAYNDGSLTPISGGVRWTYDFASWVALVGNTATCTQPAPTILGIPMTSQITATATVNGASYTAYTLLTCL